MEEEEKRCLDTSGKWAKEEEERARLKERKVKK